MRLTLQAPYKALSSCVQATLEIPEPAYWQAPNESH